MLRMLKRERGDTVSPEEFVFAMKIHIGGDVHRTQKPYFALMKETKLIEVLEDGRIRILSN